MSRVARLEAARDAAITFRHRGQVYTLPTPEELSIEGIVETLETRIVPGTPMAMEMWKTLRLGDLWALRHDLPDPKSLHRLLYLVDHYYDAIEADLFGLADVAALWRARRFRLLLNLIDHLPRNSNFSAAVGNDEEHAKMLAQAMADREEDGERPRPPLATWSPEAEGLAVIYDAIKHLEATLIATNGGKAPALTPYPRPQTALDRITPRAKHDARMAKHKALAALVLPKSTSSDPVV